MYHLYCKKISSQTNNVCIKGQIKKISSIETESREKILKEKKKPKHLK